MYGLFLSIRQFQVIQRGWSLVFINLACLSFHSEHLWLTLSLIKLWLCVSGWAQALSTHLLTPDQRWTTNEAGTVIMLFYFKTTGKVSDCWLSVCCRWFYIWHSHSDKVFQFSVKLVCAHRSVNSNFRTLLFEGQHVGAVVSSMSSITEKLHLKPR